MSYYNNNTDLFIFSCLFLSKRMIWKYYYFACSGILNKNWVPSIVILMFILALWFILLLIKICADTSLECALLLIYPLMTWILMFKFTSKKFVKCNHPSWVKAKEDSNTKTEWAPFEVLQIIKRWIFHSGEFVCFWVLMPIGLLETSELYVNSFQTIMSGVSVAGNSFFLLATLYLSKYSDELKSQAQYFGNWKKISKKEAANIKNSKSSTINGDETIIESDGAFYKVVDETELDGTDSENTFVFQQEGASWFQRQLTYLLYIFFNNPGRTYVMLLISQTVLCLTQLLYCCLRTQFLFPMIQAGLSVFVLWFMCGKKIY